MANEVEKTPVKKVHVSEDNAPLENSRPKSGDTVTRGAVGVKNFFTGLPSTITGVIYKGGKAFGKSVTRTSGTVVGKIADGLAISKRAAGIGLGVVLGITAVSGGILYSQYSYEQQVVLDEAIFEDDCKVEVEEKSQLLEGMEGDANLNALKVWSVCKALGYSDEQAAGVLGNFSTESGIDSTSVEGIYDEPYNPSGPKKLNAYKDWCSYTINHLTTHLPGGNTATDSHGHTASSSGNTAWYAGTLPNSCFRVGVGLGQFTGDNWYKLMNFVSAASGEPLDSQNCCSNSWYKIDYQLAFICCDVNNGGWQGASGGNFFTTWPNESVSSPEEAADIFLTRFEGGGSSDPNYQKRLSSARDWYNKLSGKTGDASYAQSILQLAQTSAAGGAGNAKKEAEEACEEVEEELPFDIARAAVAYAHEHYEDSYGNNGTQLYQNVHDAVYPGDIWYQSCDRGVACAVRWSGADDNYPAGDTTEQHNYLMQHSEKWEYVGKFDDLCRDINVKDGRILPGDVIIRPNGNPSGRSGHTLVYVSYDIVAEKYPNAPSNAAFVSASYMTRSAAIELWTGQHTGGNGYYEVYRCKQYDENSQYVHLFDAMKTKGKSKGKRYKANSFAGGNVAFGGVMGSGLNLTNGHSFAYNTYQGDGTLAGEMRAYARTISSYMMAQNKNGAKKWKYGNAHSKTFEEAVRKKKYETQCDTGVSWIMHKFGLTKHTFNDASAAYGRGSAWNELAKKGNTVINVNATAKLSSLMNSGKIKGPSVIGFRIWHADTQSYGYHVCLYLGVGSDGKHYWFDTGKENGNYSHGWIYTGKGVNGSLSVATYCNITSLG